MKKDYIEKDSVVSCKTCKCLVRREDAKVVRVFQAVVLAWRINLYRTEEDIERCADYYCRAHAPEHDIEFKNIDTLRFKGNLEEIRDKS